MTAPHRPSTVVVAQGERPPVKISTRWSHDIVFVSNAVHDRAVMLDGHSKEGQSPPEALLSALASCTAVDIIEILRKKRTPATRLECRTTGERFNGVPARFVAITLEYHLDGPEITETAAEHAIDLAVNKYCTVRESLDPAIRITTRLVLNGTTLPDKDASRPPRA
ncbi:MAG: OsmC family protein [Gemmatimonadetes bacterium]|nr:OsmC family protein [Gemmatimonadota bacterium]